jgi:hypothetical protein
MTEGVPMTELDDTSAPQPVLAVVGRPNVGKSTLVNRILGRREAVVEDVPGVTRDRVTYDAQWRGRRFTVVDTGGWDPDAVGIQKAVAAQAEVAVAAADAVLFVVDVNVGATDSDEAVVRVLARRRSRSCSSRTRSTTSARRPTPPCSGRSGSASRTPSRAARPGERRPARRHPRRAAETPAERFDEEAGRAASPSSAVRTSASRRC